MNTTYAGKYVALLFLARDLAHRVHLKTRSFSEHMATNDFYNNIIPLADEFAQNFEGCYGVLLEVPLMANEHKGTLLDVLKSTQIGLKLIVKRFAHVQILLCTTSLMKL